VRARAREDQEGVRTDHEAAEVRWDQEAVEVREDQVGARARNTPSPRRDYEKMIQNPRHIDKLHCNAYVHFDVAIVDKKCKASLHDSELQP
jgi:hypothetical protein